MERRSGQADAGKPARLPNEGWSGCGPCSIQFVIASTVSDYSLSEHCNSLIMALTTVQLLRACLRVLRGPAARDFGCGQGGEVRAGLANGASPQRAVTVEPTPAAGKNTAARRVFAEKAGWLRCSSVEDPPGIFSLVASRHPAFSAKTGPLGILRQALRRVRRLLCRPICLPRLVCLLWCFGGLVSS